MLIIWRKNMNEPADTMEQPGRVNDVLTVAPYPEPRTASSITPQAGCATCGAPAGALDPRASGVGCATCGAPAGASDPRASSVGMTSYVYAIGRVEARFTNLAAEKEFAQVTGRTDTAGKTDQQTFQAVLSQRENRYLVRQLC